jgi:hypothetical protein
MNQCKASVVAMTLVLSISACSGGGGSPTPDASTPDAGGPACALGTVIVPDATNIDTVSAHGDQVLYVDRSLGPTGSFPGTQTGALVQRNVDGSGETTLYTGPAGTSLRSYLATADTIYLLQSESGSPATAVLYTMPRAGGALTPVPTTAQFDALLSYLFAANGGDVFIFSPQVTGSLQQIHRVTISTGADVVIAEKDTLVFIGTQLRDGKVWFAADQGLGGVFTVDASATAPSSAPALTTDTCFNLLGGPTFFLCKSGDTSRYDLSGVDTGVFPLPGSNGPVAVALDGDTVYSIPSRDVAPYEIYAVAVSTGASTRVACGRGFITALAYDATNLLWKENGPSGRALVRVAR